MKNYTPLTGYLKSCALEHLDDEIAKVRAEKRQLERETQELRTRIELRKQMWPTKQDEKDPLDYGDYSNASTSFVYGDCEN